MTHPETGSPGCVAFCLALFLRSSPVSIQNSKLSVTFQFCRARQVSGISTLHPKYQRLCVEELTMAFKRTEKGQALILVALAAVGLFAFAALAIDGSRAFSDKRHAQNAADTAVLAGALAYTRASDADKAADATIYPIILDAASKRADSNGYYNDGIKSDVVVTAVDVPAGECPGEVDGKDITVKIVSYVDTTLARVLGREKITNAVTATSRACGFYWSPLFNGDAIVGLNPTTSQCAFDSGTSNSA